MAEKVMQHSPRTILRHPIIGGGVAGIFAGIIEYALSSGTSGLVPAVAAGVTMLILLIWDRTLTPKQEKEPHAGPALVLAVAAGVTMLILLIWDRTLTPKQRKEPHAGHAIDSKRDKEGDSKAQPESPLPVEGERIFSRRTPEELVDLVKDQTAWTAADRTRPHIGTWLRIEGPVKNIRPPSDNTVKVTVDFSRGFFLSFSLSFDETRWRDRLRILDIGDHITAIGKISRINTLGIALEECELIGH